MLRLVNGVEIMIFKHMVVEEFVIAKPVRELVVCTSFDFCDEQLVNAMRNDGRSVELRLTGTLTIKEPQLAPEDDQSRATTSRSMVVNSNAELMQVLDHCLAFSRRYGTEAEVNRCQFWFQGHYLMSTEPHNRELMTRRLKTWWIQQPGPQPRPIGADRSGDGDGEFSSPLGSSSSTDVNLGDDGESETPDYDQSDH